MPYIGKKNVGIPERTVGIYYYEGTSIYLYDYQPSVYGFSQSVFQVENIFEDNHLTFSEDYIKLN